MTPTDLLNRAGFVSVPLEQSPVGGAVSSGSDAAMVFEVSVAREKASIRVVLAPERGVLTYRAVLDGVGDGPMHLRTQDVGDVVVLGDALLNVVDPYHHPNPDYRMQGPDGSPVDNPFGFADGTWSVARRADGLDHIDLPASRWGAVYERFRSEMVARYEGKPLSAPAVDYLRAVGFAEAGTAFELAIRPMEPLDPDSDEIRNLTLKFTVEDAARGGAPTAVTDRFLVRCAREKENITDVVYEAVDVRDVLAFIDAHRNAVVFGEFGHEIEDEDRVFAHERSSMAIHNAFGDVQYGDWNVKARTDGAIIVDDPWLEFGHEYFTWRDMRAEKLLAETPAPAEALQVRP